MSSENETLAMRVLLVTGLQISALQSRILHLQTEYTHGTQLLADAREARTNFEMGYADEEDGSFFAGDLSDSEAEEYRSLSASVVEHLRMLHTIMDESTAVVAEIDSLSSRAIAAAHATDVEAE